MIYKKLTDWTVTGFHPYTAIFGKSVEVGQALMGCTATIPAQVPGSVYMDLFRAGIIDDPYYEMNSLKCEWVANRWWTYATEFEVPRSLEGRRIRLIFRGIDYKAHIYFNKMPPVTGKSLALPMPSSSGAPEGSVGVIFSCLNHASNS